MQTVWVKGARRRPSGPRRADGTAIRRLVLALVVPAAAVSLVACTDDSDPAEASPEFTGELALEVFHDREHLVGDVTDELFIAFAVSPSGDAQGPQAFTAYLCDGEDLGVWFSGELVQGEEATFEAGEDVRIVVAFEGDTVSGTVAIADGDAQPFAAVPATGRAGLTRLEAQSDDGRTSVNGWITLNDGRQRGIIPCWPGSAFWPQCLARL